MKTTTALAILSLALFYVPSAQADTFGSGPNTFDIEFVRIGNPGNPDDATGYPIPVGKVDYVYRIGKYEISEDMVNKANAETANDPIPINILHNNRGPNKAVTSVSWLQAELFVNWLNTSTGHSPAYKVDTNLGFQLWAPGDPGYDPYNPYRNRLARYFLPSIGEWYKAAYYDPTNDVYYDWPTGSNTMPAAVTSGTAAGTTVYSASAPADITLAGGLSPYGTMAQGGNVWEWQETAYDLVNDNMWEERGLRGGSYYHGSQKSNALGHEQPGVTDSTFHTGIGFRVASTPEPSSLVLAALASVVVLIWRRR